MEATCLKILILNHFPLEGSGSGVYTRNLARELSGMGHDIMVLMPEMNSVDTRDEGFETQVVTFREDKAALKHSNQIRRQKSAEVPEPSKPGAADDGPQVDLEFAIPCFTSHPRSHMTFQAMTNHEIEQYRQAFKKRIAEIVTTFKPQLIHVNHIWILAELAAETGLPYVVTSHGTDLFGYAADERYRAAARRGASGACFIVTISKQVDQEVASFFGIVPERRKLILNGCNTALFHKKKVNPGELLASYGIDETAAHVVCFAGKLAAFKGVDILLKAAAYYEKHQGLHGSPGKIVTVIAGDGILRENLILLSQTLNLKNVYFLGYLPQDRLVELYSISDVFVIPSRNEPFGLVALEAMSCGLPVVGTDQGGLVDYITPDVGRLVPPEDPKSLADAILSELSLPLNEKNSRSSTCQRLVHERFSWNGVARKMENIYQSCLQQIQDKVY
jgi:glycosyltransferase involved in cell wall biosynthesis